MNDGNIGEYREIYERLSEEEKELLEVLRESLREFREDFREFREELREAFREFREGVMRDFDEMIDETIKEIRQERERYEWEDEPYDPRKEYEEWKRAVEILRPPCKLRDPYEDYRSPIPPYMRASRTPALDGMMGCGWDDSGESLE